jgi:hypothetical protein
MAKIWHPQNPAGGTAFFCRTFLERPRSRGLKIAQDQQPDKDKTPVGSPRRR